MQHQIISQTKNGRVFKCPSCNLIHFEYKNLNFNFEIGEFKRFAKYFLRLNGLYWEARNANCQFKRKILIPIGHENFQVLLNNEELEELKRLFAFSHIPASQKFDLSNSDFCQN